MGTLSAPPSGYVYVDANTVIYAVERIEPYRTVLEPLWPAAQQRQISFITSELTWLETLVKPLRDNNTLGNIVSVIPGSPRDAAGSGDTPYLGARSTITRARVKDTGRPSRGNSNNSWM